MLDITAPKHVEIQIRDDGKVVWINTEEGCILRFCRIEKLVVIDDRKVNETNMDDDEIILLNEEQE